MTSRKMKLKSSGDDEEEVIMATLNAIKPAPKHPVTHSTTASQTPSAQSQRSRSRRKGSGSVSHTEVFPSEYSPCEMVQLFFGTLLPDYSSRGAVYALALGTTIASTFFFIAGGQAKPPWSPFRCDDRTLHKQFLVDPLPTTYFVPLMVAAGTALILAVEFRSPDVKVAEAVYWVARCLRRFYVGIMIIGNATFTIQLLANEKRPYFIDACQPAVYMPDGNEVLACPEVRNPDEPAALLNTPSRPNKVLRLPIFTAGENITASGTFAATTASASNVLSGDVAARLPAGHSSATEKPGTGRAITVHTSGVGNSSFQSDTRSAASGTTKRLTSSDRPYTVNITSVEKGALVSTIIMHDTSSSRARQGVAKPGRSPGGVVVDYHCSGPYSRQSGSSFPSGHSAAAGFESAFLFAHSVYKLWNFNKPFQATALSLLLATCAVSICVQRVVSNHNHIVDVLCGFAIGASGGTIFAIWPYHEGLNDI